MTLSQDSARAAAAAAERERQMAARRTATALTAAAQRVRDRLGNSHYADKVTPFEAYTLGRVAVRQHGETHLERDLYYLVGVDDVTLAVPPEHSRLTGGVVVECECCGGRALLVKNLAWPSGAAGLARAIGEVLAEVHRCAACTLQIPKTCPECGRANY